MREKNKYKERFSLRGLIDAYFSQNKYLTIGISISFILIFLMVTYSMYGGFFISRLRLAGFSVGERAARDFIAIKDFTYIDQAATKILRDKKAAAVLKVFKYDDQAVLRVNSEFEKFSTEYISVIEKKNKNSEMLKNLENRVSTIDLDFLLTKVDPSIVIPAVSTVLEKLLIKGIVKIPVDLKLSSTDFIKIWHWESGRRVYSEHEVSKLLTLSNVDKAIEDNLMYQNFPEKEKYAIHLLVRKFIRENIFYDPIQTNVFLGKVKNDIPPVTVKIVKGDKIISKGFPVTKQQISIARALVGIRIDSSTAVQAAGGGLYLLLLYILGILLFLPYFSNTKRKTQYIYVLLVLSLFYTLYVSIIIHITDTYSNMEFSFFIPVALFSMLFSVILDSKTGNLLALLFSLFLFIFPNTTSYDFIFSLVSGLSGAYFVRKIEKRLDLVKAGLYLAVVNILIVLIISLYLGMDFTWFIKAGLMGVLNAFLCSILNLSLLPIFEHLLNLPTSFRLVELSDMSMPIFKKMITLAPGTYGHSMSVANLAESAARKIGANALLARVGAYYHDIGKIDQPEYFIENQKGDNKHDDLKPSLSVAVIKSHVKVGIERGKEIGLPLEIIDIIAQHHGSGVINYFYIEALKKQFENNRISKEDYAYNGETPQTKEAGIVMMADSVEAASRVLKKPTMAKLEKFVWNIMLEKVENGQFINCNITFKELVEIKTSFIQILAGHFHSRIEYPKKEGKKI